MTVSKKHTVFLSFAKPDEKLAGHVCELFKDMRESVYYAPETLRRSAGGETWRKHILDGIHSSSAFIPIYTRHSVKRPWVLFESGVAEAYGIKRFPVRAASVSMDEIELIGKDVTVYDLFDETSLMDLVFNVCKTHDQVMDPVELRQLIERNMSNNHNKDAILQLSKTRWVFIAGNVPDENSKDNKLKNEINKYVKSLTTTLLKHEFSIASCPQVLDVGKVASTTYLDFIKNNSAEGVDFRISGLYPIDRFARQHTGLDNEVTEAWKRHLNEFRKSYLSDVEWLILIGGSKGTLEEYSAAKELGTKIVFVPFFGGTAYNLWKNSNEIKRRPYDMWKQGQKSLNAQIISTYLKSYK